MVPVTPQVQLVRAMLLAQGATFAGVATHELYQELPESMARGGSGGRQRDQITRPEAPRAAPMVGARQRKRTPEVIVIESEHEEDEDYGARQRRSRPAPTRAESRPVPPSLPAKPARPTSLKMYSALQEDMVVVTRDGGKYPRPELTYMRRLLNLADYVRGQAPRWSSGTVDPNVHLLWVSAS